MVGLVDHLGKRWLARLQPFPLDMPLEDLPNAHPRAAGTRKALRLAREHGLPLMPILRQTSTESAERLAAGPLCYGRAGSSPGGCHCRSGAL